MLVEYAVTESRSDSVDEQELEEDVSEFAGELALGSSTITESTSVDAIILFASLSFSSNEN